MVVCPHTPDLVCIWRPFLTPFVTHLPPTTLAFWNHAESRYVDILALMPRPTTPLLQAMSTFWVMPTISSNHIRRTPTPLAPLILMQHCGGATTFQRLTFDTTLMMTKGENVISVSSKMVFGTDWEFSSGSMGQNIQEIGPKTTLADLGWRSTLTALRILAASTRSSDSIIIVVC